MSTSNTEEPNPIDANRLCLLSLDHGGVRGLSTLYILKRLMDRLNHERQKAELSHIKPCDLFDLIGGTSTGGCVELPMIEKASNRLV
jgi:patatin-like phospholipase/acyl hydrolase